MNLQLGTTITLPEPLERAVARVTEALKAEGFGVLTRIDLHTAFKEKLGLDHRPHTILGACNPQLAHRAITSDPLVALMLPCNVTVEELPGGGSAVRVINPVAMLGVGSLGDHPALAEVATDATARLSRVVAALTL